MKSKIKTKPSDEWLFEKAVNVVSREENGKALHFSSGLLISRFFSQLFEVSSSQTRLAVLLPFLLEILRFVFLQVFILRHSLEQFKTGFEAALASEKWKTVWKNRRIMFYLSLCVFKMSVAKRVQGT